MYIFKIYFNIILPVLPVGGVLNTVYLVPVLVSALLPLPLPLSEFLLDGFDKSDDSDDFAAGFFVGNRANIIQESKI